MMATMTSSDCYAEARLKATIITCQRKLGRFLQRIAEKESYAALYKSKFMCERYDEEIEELYTKVAELEVHPSIPWAADRTVESALM